MLALVVILSDYGVMYREGSLTGEIDYLGVHASFAETEYGAVLKSCVRYDKYRPENVSHERWEELLGPDVNNLDHMVDTYQLTRNFIGNTERLQPGLLSQRDQAVLKITAIVHDWGESVIPDINYFEKTGDDELAERQAFREHLPRFHTGDDPLTQELIAEAFEEVIFDKESRLGSMFNVIERIGYLRTGLRAAELTREQAAPDCEDNLRWLSAGVFSSDQLIRVITAGSRLSAAHHFLMVREPEITEGLATADPAIFAVYESEAEANARVDGLRESRRVWDAWQAGLHSPIR